MPKLTAEFDLDQLRNHYVGRRTGPFVSWHPVSALHIWQWCRAMGDDLPDYQASADGEGQSQLAPPTMMQMWTFRDVQGQYAPGSCAEDCYEVLKRFDDAGYSGVVAVSYDQTYRRYLRVGDRISSYSTIVSISDRKSTAMGNGYFVTEQAEYLDAERDCVGTAQVTYFKYQPPEARPATDSSPRKIQRIAPVENHDSRHYWQGLRDGKLLIQICSSCNTPRHPPQPMCEHCQSLDWHTVESTGQGSIFSYTALHYPEIPPFDYPSVLVLVDLDEGVRLASQMLDVAPADISVGARVSMSIETVQDNLALPLFRLVSS